MRNNKSLTCKLLVHVEINDPARTLQNQAMPLAVQKANAEGEEEKNISASSPKRERAEPFSSGAFEEVHLLHVLGFEYQSGFVKLARSFRGEAHNHLNRLS